MTQPDTTSTRGSDQREGRRVDMPFARFDLADELGRLGAEQPGHDRERQTITLARAGMLRLVLTRASAGAEFGADDVDGALALVVLDGTLTVRRAGATERASVNQVVVIDGGSAWRALPETDVAVLLVMAWPDDREPAFAG